MKPIALFLLLGSLCWSGCGGGGSPIPERSEPVDTAMLRKELYGFWEMLSWGNQPPESLQLDEVLLWFKEDGSWEWISRLADSHTSTNKIFAGGGQWDLKGRHLMLMKDQVLRETDIYFRGGELYFDRDPAVLKDGLMPGPSHYRRQAPIEPVPGATNQPPAEVQSP